MYGKMQQALLEQLAAIKSQGLYKSERIIASPQTPQLKLADGQELLEIIEERSQTGSIIITSQLEVKDWYAYLAEPTIADAILDRIIHNAHRICLEGDSMRKVKISLQHSDTLE